MQIMRTFFAPRLPGLSQGRFLALQGAYFVVGALGLLLLGAISYRVVEQPFLRLKRLFAVRTARR